MRSWQTGLSWLSFVSIILRGICRAMKVSLCWLLDFMASEHEQLPEDLNYRARVETDKLLMGCIESEIDEMWSFVGHRAFQLHHETADIPFSQEGSLFLQEAEEPHWRHQVFHLPL